MNFGGACPSEEKLRQGVDDKIRNETRRPKGDTADRSTQRTNVSQEQKSKRSPQSGTSAPLTLKPPGRAEAATRPPVMRLARYPAGSCISMIYNASAPICGRVLAVVGTGVRG